MAGSDIQALIARFEAARAGSRTATDARALLQDLQRTAGLSGRSDKAVPMINGAVVSAADWAEHGPRFTRLRDELQTLIAEYARQEVAALRARHVQTLRLSFPAWLESGESGERLQDVAALQRCHGAIDQTRLESALKLDDTPALPLPIAARLQYDAATRELEVTLEIALSRRPTDAEITTLAGRVQAAMFSGWGTNYDFRLPKDVDDYVLHFASQAERHEISS